MRLAHLHGGLEGELAKIEPVQAFQHAQLGMALVQNMRQDDELKRNWQFATAGYHVPMGDYHKDGDPSKLLQQIEAGRNAAIAGILTVIGRTFREQCGEEADRAEWVMYVLRGEWLCETLLAVKGQVRVLPTVARSCKLADGDLHPETPCVVIDCVYRFEKRAPK